MVFFVCLSLSDGVLVMYKMDVWDVLCVLVCELWFVVVVSEV